MKKNFVKNTKTDAIIEIPTPVDWEVAYDGKVMITETDLRGVVTFANRKFIEMTGYPKEELIGSPHSINRHPDMPKSAFKEMWKLIKSAQPWQGIVKNLRKDGKYYWVDVWVQAKYDDDNKHIGYIAGRKVPHAEDITKYSALYKQMIEDEKNGLVDADVEEKSEISIKDVINRLEADKQLHIKCINNAQLLINNEVSSINNTSIKSSHCSFAKWIYGESEKLRFLHINMKSLSQIEVLHTELRILYNDICNTFNKSSHQLSDSQKIVAQAHFDKLVETSKILFAEIAKLEKEILNVKVA